MIAMPLKTEVRGSLTTLCVINGRVGPGYTRAENLAPFIVRHYNAKICAIQGYILVREISHIHAWPPTNVIGNLQ